MDEPEDGVGKGDIVRRAVRIELYLRTAEACDCNEETKRRRFDIRIIDEVIRLRGVTIRKRLRASRSKIENKKVKIKM